MEKKTLMSLFIVMLMVLSVVGFVLVDSGDDEAKRRFGDYTFYRTSDGWRVTVAGSLLYFNFLPEQVQDIVIDADVSALLRNPVLGVSYDPEDRFAEPAAALQYYVEQLLGEQESVFVVRGLTNTSRFPQLPLLTCENATSTFPVIVFARGNETRVIRDDSCVIASAAVSQDLFRLTDRLLYDILGVL